MPKRQALSVAVRQFVIDRAIHVCEYCLIHEADTHFGCQIDHILSLKHGGSDTDDNLAYACAFCNRAKGSDVGSAVPTTGEFVRFFNPRTDIWRDHFTLDGVIIRPLTDIGIVTARILQFNTSERLLERHLLQALGRYPSPAAVKKMIQTSC